VIGDHIRGVVLVTAVPFPNGVQDIKRGFAPFDKL